jgi:membrane protease YdiL (CAAX protease family)
VYGERAAVITSALIFGLAHGNLSQLFYAFGLGLALGYVYIKTRRIVYTIILHMLVNLIGGVLAPLALNSEATGLTAVFGVIVFGMVVAGLVFFIRNVKKVSFSPSPLMQRKWAQPALLNVGMILFFVVSVLLIIYSTIAAYMPMADYSASVSYVFL